MTERGCDTDVMSLRFLKNRKKQRQQWDDEDGATVKVRGKILTGREHFRAEDFRLSRFVNGLSWLNVGDLKRVKQFLRSNPRSRKKEDILWFKCIGEQIPFFSKLHHEHQRLTLYRQARLRLLQTGDRLSNQGDPADALYIILSGSVNVAVSATSETAMLQDLKEMSKCAKRWVPTTKELEYNEYVVAGLGPTDSFGEVGLDRSDALRTASVIAVEDCLLMSISAAMYNNVKANMLHERLDDVMDTLRNVPCLAHMSESSLKEIGDSCEVRMYPEDKVIVKQGDPVRTVYIVKHGILREIRRQKVLETDKHAAFLELRELQPFDIFGVHALVTNIIRARLHVDDHMPLFHDWGLDEGIRHRSSVCVKHGEVRAEVILIKLSEFIRLTMHDAIARKSLSLGIVNLHHSKEKIVQDIDRKINAIMEHEHILEDTSPRYIQRRGV